MTSICRILASRLAKVDLPAPPEPITKILFILSQVGDIVTLAACRPAEADRRAIDRSRNTKGTQAPVCCGCGLLTGSVVS